MKRRGQGEGSIFWREDKQRWVAKVTLPGAKARTHMARTKREAQEWLAETARAARQGTLATGPKQTVEQYLAFWLPNVAKPSVKLRSWKSYESLVRVHLIPGLGKLPMEKLTPQHLQAFYGEKLEAGLAARTVTHIHRCLHRALRDALRLDIVSRNVCDRVTPPRAEKAEVRTLDDDQLCRFLQAARTDRFGTLYVVAACTGLREGELLALRWQDVDDAGRSLQVRRTVWYSRETGFVFTEPKSKTSRRRVDLIDTVLEVLREHREDQCGQKLLAGEDWEENDLVFCNELGEPLKVWNFYRVSYKKLLRDAGLPDISFHALRHSLATALLVQGEHPRVVQELLGHSTIAITMDTYSHVAPTLQRQAVDRLQRRLSVVGSIMDGPSEGPLEGISEP